MKNYLFEIILSVLAIVLAGGAITGGAVKTPGDEEMRQYSQLARVEDYRLEDLLSDAFTDPSAITEDKLNQVQEDLVNEWTGALEEEGLDMSDVGGMLQETEEASEEPAEPDVTIQNDTSTGTCEMATRVEDNGYLYYSNDDQLYRQKLDGSTPELLITEDENGKKPGSVLITEQYMYVYMWRTGLEEIVQYTKDGQKTGILLLPKYSCGTALQYSNGWFYYSDSSIYSDPIYRVRAQYGSVPEEIVGNEAGTFFVQGDYIYYLREDIAQLNEMQLCNEGYMTRIKTDGTDKQTVRTDFSFDNDMVYLENFQGDKFYFYDPDVSDSCYRCMDLNTGTDTVITQLEESDYQPYENAYMIQGLLVNQEFYSSIYVYNPQTGTNTCIVPKAGCYVSEDIKIRYVAGATRVYYTHEGRGTDNPMADTFFCINLDGSGKVMLGDAMDYPIG